MKPKLRRGFTLIELLISITVIAILAAFATNTAISIMRVARTNETISNMNNILTMIGLFQQEMSRMPTGTEDTSNSHLSELFAEGYLDGGGEALFFVEGAELCTTKPDGIIGGIGAPDALETGTCGFAYVANLKPTSNSGCPILFDAYYDGTSFDPDIHAGKVLVGTLSGAVKRADVDGSKALGVNGINFADVLNTELYGAQSGDQKLVQPSS